MKPFSTRYYIKENRWRAASVVAMFVLTFSLYLGGLYISNVETVFSDRFERIEKVAFIVPDIHDEGYEEFDKAVAYLQQEPGITMLHQGVISNIYTTSLMNFNIGGAGHFSFRNEEDFQTYCDFLGIHLVESCGDEGLPDGSLIMSGLQAKNRGLKIGDKFVAQDDDEWVDQEYTLRGITDEEGYSVYYISNSENMNYMLLPTDMDIKEFRRLLSTLKTEYDIYVRDVDSFRKEIDRQLNSLQYIYFFIIILVSIVMAVTINAAFAGMYQHRNGEFALYKAIGISRKKIRLKIMKEVLLLDILGIIIGLALVMLVVYILNHLFLLEKGMQLFYYNKMSVIGMLVSNLIVLFPVTIVQSVKLLKADICDY